MSSDNNINITEELAMIAHEFRRPIDTISKSAELVNRAQKTGNLDLGKLSEIMDGIVVSCNRLSLLTSHISSIIQLENGTYKLIVEKLNLVDFIFQLEQYVVSYQDKKNVKFNFDVKLKNPYMICDFKKLESILLNLISNAVKYSRRTDRKITVRVFDERDIMYFCVKDKGIGIPLSKQEDIFKMFYRVEGFSTRQTEGCGLGLSIVKSFTEALGGIVHVISDEDKGSEFVVRIPRVQDVSSPSKIVEVANNYQMYKTSVDEVFADI